MLIHFLKIDSAESVESSTEKAHGRNHGHASTSSNCNNCVVCSACSTPDSHGIESFPNSPYCEETRPLNGARSRSTSGEREDVKVSNPTPKRSVTAVIRNVLGVLLIAGVSFMLGAKVGSLGFKRERTPTGSENWADIKQVGLRNFSLWWKLNCISAGCLLLRTVVYTTAECAALLLIAHMFGLSFDWRTFLAQRNWEGLDPMNLVTLHASPNSLHIAFVVAHFGTASLEIPDRTVDRSDEERI